MPLYIEDATKNGIEVVKQCATWFFHSNRSHYLTQGFECEDIEGHLNLEVLMRYLDLVRNHPNYYEKATKKKDEMATFRASLFQSCRNACFAHHRKHIRSQKRGLNLRNGMVHLDHEDTNAEGITHHTALVTHDHGNISGLFKPVADDLYASGQLVATRLWCLVWYENRSMRDSLLHDLGDDRDFALHEIRLRISAHLPALSPNSTINTNHTHMDPALKERFKKAALAARNKNPHLISAAENSESPVRAKLLNAISTMDDTQVASVLSMVDGTGATSQVARGVRREVVEDNARRWLNVDYEIVSEALDIEINPEMNPLIVRRVIGESLNVIPVQKREQIPEIVWDFIRSLEAVFPGVVDEGGELHIALIGDTATLSTPTSPPAFISHMRNSPRWTSWIDGHSVGVWQHGDKVCLQSEVLEHFETGDALRHIFASFG